MATRLTPRQLLVRVLAALFGAIVVFFGAVSIIYIGLGTAHPEPGLPSEYSRTGVAILALYSVVFSAVGLSVLTLRPGDRNAWTMAVLFACFLAIPTIPVSDRLPPVLAAFVRIYSAVALPAIPAVFYSFFATFPVRSPVDRLLPWLRWLLVGFFLVLASTWVSTGTLGFPPPLETALGPRLASGIRRIYLFGGMPLGVLALSMTAASAPTPEARRKARALLWGTLTGTLTLLIEQAAESILQWQPPTWVYLATLAVAAVFPLSVAYAIVRHRVIDVPVLLRRSARYLLVRRGFYVLILFIAVSVTATFAATFSQFFDVEPTVGMVVGVAFGIVLSVSSAPLLRRTTRRIDRAFFRGAYDATAILENLAETIRSITSRDALAALLEHEIAEALHPLRLALYLEGRDGLLRPLAMRSTLPLDPVSPDEPWIRELAVRGKPWEVPPVWDRRTPQALRDIRAEWVVPIVGRDGRAAGLIILGPRLSEEPYSRDDRRLLAAVATQAAIELDSIRLAEQMAERLDAERAAQRELEIARQVQFRLFPQKQPALATLDYAGGCLQARQVGGDYYDFVALGPQRVGLVVADISGKGIAGALLMANLQANLRSQYATGRDDLPRLLKSVNQLFYDNTGENQYATLVFAAYDDATRRLRYANCGHFPPYLLRASGEVEQLMPTALVLGLFEEWESPMNEILLQPGDTLVIYTDGVIDAARAGDEEEFGPARLVATIQANRKLPAADLVAAVHTAVADFCGGSPSDDLTVVVAHVR